MCTGCPIPTQPDRFTFLDVVDALDAMPKPTVLVIEQRWPPELRAKAGLAGEIMTTQMQQVGCVGLVTDGPSRDVDAIRRLGFQLLLNGVSAGHGPMAVHAVNVAVSVGGMDVTPGELVHMDENGAVRFPADRAAGRSVERQADARARGSAVVEAQDRDDRGRDSGGRRRGDLLAACVSTSGVADHDHRHIGMGDDHVGHRAEQQGLEPTPPARSDHQEVGVLGRVEQRPGGVAFEQ